jgi:uncharacterized protein YbaP (TraB family)
MWEIEGGQNKAFLLGSLHTMPKDIYPLNEKIEQAFDVSDVLVVEVDATTLDQDVVNNFIIANAVYRDSTNLQSVLDKELFVNISKKFQELGFSEDQLKVFKPWFVSLNLGLGALQKIEITTGQGIDLHFLTKAHERKLPIVELETALLQLEALSSMDKQTQIDYLQYSVEDYENANENFQKTLECWKTGKAEEMNLSTKKKLFDLKDELPGILHYYNNLFVDRDKKIAEKLSGYLENEENHTYFIIVGALHLVGEDGLLKLLQNKGYRTTQK